MKRTFLTFAISLAIFLSIFIVASGKNIDSSEPSNPLVGTWTALGGYDSTGKIIEFYGDEVGYETLLENGKFFAIGFRKNFPQTGVNPTTLEEYEEIGKNCWGRIGTYTVDLENNKIHVDYTHDLRPNSIGHKLNINFKVVGDTAIYWFDNGKTFYKYLRVK